MSESSEQNADPHLEALRKVYAKLLEIERKVDAITSQPTQAGMKLKGAAGRRVSPEFTLLRARMLLAWREAKGVPYDFASRDAKGLSGLLKRGFSINELVARWTFAFKNGCVSIYEFEMNFNKYLPSQGSSRPVVDGATDLYREKK